MQSLIRLGDAEPVTVLIKDRLGTPLLNKTNIKARVWRVIGGSTLQFLDWADLTFKAAGSVTTMLQALSEVDNTNAGGAYRIVVDTTAITNVLDGDVLEVEVVQDGGVDAVGLPIGGQIKVGAWVDEMLLRDVVIKQSYSYSPATDDLTGLIWAEWENKVQTGATSLTVGWYNADGTLLFSMSNASPDAQGVFKVSQNAPGLTTNTIYYAKPSLTLPGIATPVDGVKAPFTVG